METNKFQLYGNKGLNIYNDWIQGKNKNNNKYTYEILANMDEYSSYDIMQIKHNKEDYTTTSTSYIEVKTRNVSITDYNDCVIDSYKITNLQELSRVTDTPCFLCVIYEADDKLALWKIKPDKNYPTIIKKAKWHTAAEDGVKKDKELVCFPLSDAKICNYRYNSTLA